LSVFHILKGLEEEKRTDGKKKNSFETAIKYFHACRDMYTKMNPAPGSFRRPEFVIGKKLGIFSLLTFSNEKDKSKNVHDFQDYMEFEGEVVRDRRIIDLL
jgi:hypothetical protein